jgi:hypothetical protein
VSNGVHHYYPTGVPDIIEVTDHRFIETRVVQMWRIDMNVAWCVSSLSNTSDLESSYEITISGNLQQTVLERMTHLSTIGMSCSQKDGP